MVTNKKKERRISEPRPEEIFTCAKCGQPIIAYGERGESFVIVGDKDPKYYHGNCAPAT